MKKILFTLFALLFIFSKNEAQDVLFSLANPQTTNGGASYEADVTIISTAGFALGSGQLYFNYNTAAFGDNVVANNRVTFSYPAGSILATQVGSAPFAFDFYDNFIKNDNTTSRLSFAWQHAFSGACLGGNNISTTPIVLFHIKLDFIPSGIGLPSDLCFESAPLFIDQTFTACEGASSPATCETASCFASPGTQITNDTYDCAAIALPIELMSFTAYRKRETAHLAWITLSETQSDYFEIQHATDGISFKKIGTKKGAGTTSEMQHYTFIHAQPSKGINYYRLKSVDFDGSTELSVIRSVRFDDLRSDFQIYPSPTKDFLYFNQSLESAYTVVNALGQIVLSGVFSAEEKLDVSTLPAGVYSLVVLSRSRQKWEGRFMKVD